MPPTSLPSNKQELSGFLDTPVEPVGQTSFYFKKLEASAELCLPSWGQVGSWHVFPISEPLLHNIAVEAWQAISKANLRHLSDDDDEEEKLSSLRYWLNDAATQSVAQSFAKLRFQELNRPLEKLELDNLSVPYTCEYQFAQTKADNGGVIFELFRPSKFHDQDSECNGDPECPTSLNSRGDTIKGIGMHEPKVDYKGRIQFRPRVLLESGAERELQSHHGSKFILHMQEFLNSIEEDSEAYSFLGKDMMAGSLSDQTKTLLQDEALSWIHRSNIRASYTRYSMCGWNKYLLDVSWFVSSKHNSD